MILPSKSFCQLSREVAEPRFPFPRELLSVEFWVSHCTVGPYQC